VRVLLGFGVYSAGLAAFVAEIGMRPAFWEGGTYAGLEGVPFFCGGGVHLDALLDAHDLRLAALITAACGLMLALSAAVRGSDAALLGVLLPLVLLRDLLLIAEGDGRQQRILGLHLDLVGLERLLLGHRAS